MMRFFSWLKTLVKKQNGLTLIETLVALAITGVVATSVTTALCQLQSISNDHYTHIIAVNQVENAVYCMNRDVQSSQTISPAPQGNHGFPLTLTWVSWDTNVTNTVIYDLENDPSSNPYSDSHLPTLFELTRQSNQDPSAIIARFIVSYPDCNTTLTTASVSGNTTLKVASTAGFPSVGSLELSGEPLPITYFSKTSTSFTGIPACGSGSLTLAHPVGDPVTTYSSSVSYAAADHKLILQLTSCVPAGSEQNEQRRQVVIVPRPGS